MNSSFTFERFGGIFGGIWQVFCFVGSLSNSGFLVGMMGVNTL